MKTIKILITFLVIFWGTKSSNAQFDVTIIGNNNGQTLVIPDLPDESSYVIGVQNGGLFPIMLSNYKPGTVYWGGFCNTPTIDIINPHCGSGRYTVIYQKNDNVWYYIDMYIRYFLQLSSDILNASTGTWTGAKELTLPPGVTSVNMNVVTSVANNFLAFSWNIENDDLSLTEINTFVQGNSHDVVNINMNGKSQIKIIIIAYDSDNSGYFSQDYFYIKSSGPTVYNLSGSGSYCQGTSGRTITLSNSETGTSYQLKDGNNANVGSPLNGTDGTPLHWPNITAGSYTVVATNAGGTATMNGTVVITMDPYPSKPVIAGDGFVQLGETSVYTATANHATSWSWFLSPSGLANSTPSGQTTTLSFVQTGTLTLTAQASNMCGNSEVSNGFSVKIVDISGMEAQINQLKTDTALYKSTIRFLQTDSIPQLHSVIATVTNERNQALAANTLLQQQVGDLQTDTALYKSTIRFLQTDSIPQLHTVIATVTNERNQALANNAILQAQVTQLEADKIALQNQVNDLTGQVATLTASNTALQNQVDTLTATNLALQQQVATLTASNTALQNQVDTLTATNLALQQQVATLTANNTALQNQVDTLTATNLALQQQVSELEAQLAIYSQVYILNWEVTGVTTHVFPTEIGDFSISLYPNPSPGVVFISCTEEIKEIKIFNLQGQLIKEFIVNSFETSFTVTRADMPPGTYLVHIQTTKGDSTHRFIFQ